MRFIGLADFGIGICITLVLVSESGNAADCIMAGDGAVITATDVPNLFLANLTITDGVAVLSVENGAVCVEAVVFDGNSATGGSAIFVEDGVVDVTSCSPLVPHTEPRLLAVGLVVSYRDVAAYCMKHRARLP